ncbi:ABC transporter permease [Oceaniglobus trochenteri]|uniref:ABC transporter permease n=1 Tax=Oceaniglobus trochenteri TaxID=2763260 RepID=UPI001CFFF0CA|nr:ABC transporter permease [Oceaniglobus trochenteri]
MTPTKTTSDVTDSRDAGLAIPADDPPTSRRHDDRDIDRADDLPVANEDRTVLVAGQWKLIWWKFRKHKLAMLGGIITLFIYFVAVFVEILAPFPPDQYNSTYPYAPPQSLHLGQVEGEFGLYVNGYAVSFDPETLARTFVIDEEVRHPVSLFAKGAPYRLWGLIPMERHLIAPDDPSHPMYLLGADRLGRDMLSRLIHGTRISMSIGLIGVAISLFLGVLLGGISGYYGGATDNLIQRVIEFLNSIPKIPLWMGLAAAIPLSLPPLHVYFLITLILSLIGWTGLARVVRGRFFSLKTEDFVTAARLDGNSELRIIMRHMVPSFTSHIIASISLAIPSMILAETSLSFLGIGLRPPVVSWGVLLEEAQNVRSIAQAPWLFWPGAAVVVAVLAMNFLGDGLRDAADPYA